MIKWTKFNQFLRLQINQSIKQIFICNNVTVRLIVLNQLIETGSIQTTTYIFIWNNLIVRLIVFNQLIEIGPMQTDPTEQEETSLNMYRADESRSGTIC